MDWIGVVVVRRVMKVDADGNRVECTEDDLLSIEKTHKDSAEWVKMPNKRSWVKHCLVGGRASGAFIWRASDNRNNKQCAGGEILCRS